MIVIGDSDCSCDFFELDRLISPLGEGYDYVLGSRFAGTIVPGGMPFVNRYLGNPVLTALLNSLFRLDISDARGGMRAFTRCAYERMGLQRQGMEFDSEIVIAAAQAALGATDVPITYHPRLGPSKLRRRRDGLRHLRFMFSEALFPQSRGTSSGRPLPGVAVMSGNGSVSTRANSSPRASRRRPVCPVQRSTRARQGGQPPAARPEVP